MKRFDRIIWCWQYRSEELRRYHFNESEVWREALYCIGLGLLRIICGAQR